ncbi:MAG: PAS domain-containing protein [Acidobacteria bacterium]|nr:PAS domain-containing protein [Acidobacteriota bacterium]
MSNGEVKGWLSERLFDLVPIQIAVIDRSLRIVHANERFRHAYGDSVGKHCYEVYKKVKFPCTRCGPVQCFKDGHLRVSEEKGIVREGEQTWYVVHAVPLKADDGSIPFVLEMSVDVTELKNLKQEKIEAERLAAVGQTVAGLAHGIKNIVMGLEGGMYIINSGLARNDPERLRNGWSILQKDIARISAFAKEFLDFARGRTPKVELADPNQIARSVGELYHELGRISGVDITTILDPGMRQAPLDVNAIHTCLANLVSNAIDACEMSDQGGPHRVVITTRDVGGRIVLEVADDGCGMDYEVQRKVFSSFFSTKASGKGTGLGLLTTRKVVQEHGGTVSFESSEGAGSTFRIELFRDRLPTLTEPNECSVETKDA